MKIDLDAALAELLPTGDGPAIRERRPRWPAAAGVALALALSQLPASPGEPILAMTPPGVYEQIRVSGAVVNQRCGGAVLDNGAFDASQMVDLGGGTACRPGFNRLPTNPGVAGPPTDVLGACATAAGYPSFEGWTVRASGNVYDQWLAILASRNGWQASCSLSRGSFDVWFSADDPSHLVPLELSFTAQGDPPEIQLVVAGAGPVWQPDGTLARSAKTIEARVDGMPTVVRFPVRDGYVIGHQDVGVNASGIGPADLRLPRVTYRVLDASGHELFTWTG